MPPELLLDVLRDERIATEEKQIFMELLVTLYLRYHRLPPVPENLMPEVLQLDDEYQEGGFVEKESEKLFVMNVVDMLVAERIHERNRLPSASIIEDQPHTEIEETDHARMKEELGDLLVLAQNKGDDYDDLHA